jgi:hypothetical protein
MPPPRAAGLRAPAVEEPTVEMQALDVRISRLEQSLSEARNDVAGLKAARDEARTEAARAKAQVEKLSSELSRVLEELGGLASRQQAEREERLAAAERATARHDLAAEQLSRRLEEIQRERVEQASPPKPVRSPAQDVALKPLVATQAGVRKELAGAALPIFRVPDRELERPGVLRGFLVKAAVLVLVVGTVVATQRKHVGHVADKLMNMPKNAATQTGMANAVTIVRADFVDKPLPAPGEFVAYLKSRAVANVDEAGIDGWGTEYRLDLSPSAIRSAGPDRRYDTPDDIVMELEGAK